MRSNCSLNTPVRHDLPLSSLSPGAQIIMTKGIRPPATHSAKRASRLRQPTRMGSSLTRMPFPTTYLPDHRRATSKPIPTDLMYAQSGVMMTATGAGEMPLPSRHSARAARAALLPRPAPRRALMAPQAVATRAFASTSAPLLTIEESPKISRNGGYTIIARARGTQRRRKVRTRLAGGPQFTCSAVVETWVSLVQPSYNVLADLSTAYWALTSS